jgi:hypothetical protein
VPLTVDLDAAELAEPVRTAENTALVLIDFQRDFCEAGGYADTIDDIGLHAKSCHVRCGCCTRPANTR